MTQQPTLPAEWAEQDAIMLTWPHSDTDWAPYLDEVEEVFFAISEAILADEGLLISCEDASQLQACRERLGPIAQQHGNALTLYEVPADDTWARDHGPITVYDRGHAVLLDFEFNAWGDKFASARDNAITQNLVDRGAFPKAQHHPVDMILEGGSIESDGQGTLLTTANCLLTSTRNHQLNRADIESELCTLLGVERVLWLEHGHLEGDDTDAHIDTLVRFCRPDTLCYVQCTNSADPHFATLKAMEDELKALKTQNGTPYKLVALPMCDPIVENEERLPATYANFLITNHSILLPTYGSPQDEEAITIMQNIFPERKIVPINCRPLIRQYGSLHCLTMQLPKGVMA